MTTGIINVKYVNESICASKVIIFLLIGVEEERSYRKERRKNQTMTFQLSCTKSKLRMNSVYSSVNVNIWPSNCINLRRTLCCIVNASLSDQETLTPMCIALQVYPFFMYSQMSAMISKGKAGFTTHDVCLACMPGQLLTYTLNVSIGSHCSTEAKRVAGKCQYTPLKR